MKAVSKQYILKIDASIEFKVEKKDSLAYEKLQVLKPSDGGGLAAILKTKAGYKSFDNFKESIPQNEAREIFTGNEEFKLAKDSLDKVSFIYKENPPVEVMKEEQIISSKFFLWF